MLDKALIPIMDKVKVVPNEEFEALFLKFQPSRVTITTNDGRRRRYTVLRSTDAYGDPWDPWDAVGHFLDDRFSRQQLRTSTRRTGSRVGVS